MTLAELIPRSRGGPLLSSGFLPALLTKLPRKSQRGFHRPHRRLAAVGTSAEQGPHLQTTQGQPAGLGAHPAFGDTRVKRSLRQRICCVLIYTGSAGARAPSKGDREKHGGAGGTSERTDPELKEEESGGGVRSLARKQGLQDEARALRES